MVEEASSVEVSTRLMVSEGVEDGISSVVSVEDGTSSVERVEPTAIKLVESGVGVELDGAGVDSLVSEVLTAMP